MLKFTISTGYDNDPYDVEIDEKDFPIGKKSLYGAEINDNTIGVTINDVDNLNNFDPIESFEEAMQASYYEFPVLIINGYNDISADYMQGVCDWIHFYN